MDIIDSMHIGPEINPKEYYGGKTNIKRKDIFRGLDLPYSDESIVYYVGCKQMAIFLDYSQEKNTYNLWENNRILHLQGDGKYRNRNDVEHLTAKDKVLFYMDRNDIAIHLFYSENGEKYRYGHVMICYSKPYQIEVFENGTYMYKWIFVMLPGDASYKVSDNFCFGKCGNPEGYKGDLKVIAEEMSNDILEDAILIQDVTRNMCENIDKNREKSFYPKEKQIPIIVDGKRIYKRDRQTAYNVLMYADFSCEINRSHLSFISRYTNKKYMEPHHLVPLAYSYRFDVSLDVEANIVSLCSECHNEIHYGVNAAKMLTQLYNTRKDILMQAGINISLKELFEMYDIDLIS